MTLDNKFKAADQAVDHLITALAAKIQDAAANKEFNIATTYTKSAAALSEIKTALSDQREALLGPDGAKPAFTVSITEGALKNHYLSVTQGMNSGFVKAGQDIIVKLPDGEQFTSKVLKVNRLRERGRIGKFFAGSHIKAGDVVKLAETTQGVWELSKV